MKTKNFLLAAVLLISGLLSVNGVFAETPGPTSSIQSADVKVNIIFTPIQTITVNADASGVDINYTDKVHYASGTSTEIDNHLNVYSTGGFTVSVLSEAYFTSTNTKSTPIPATDVKVLVRGTAVEGSLSFNEVALGTTGGDLIISQKGGSDLSYDITYNNTNTSEVTDRYIDKYIADDEGQSVYSAVVTYSINPS